MKYNKKLNRLHQVTGRRIENSFRRYQCYQYSLESHHEELKKVKKMRRSVRWVTR